MMMLGNSVKLMGLAGLNVFVALALAATYLSEYGSSRLQALTDDNVNAFFREAEAITTGKRGSMSEYAITSYFIQHVADDGKFRKVVHFSVPGAQDRNVVMDKRKFISELLQEMNEQGIHDASLKIDDIKISENGRKATAMTTSKERTAIKVTPPDGRESGITPVSTTSRCEQTIRLSNEHVIQMVSATCITNVVLADSQ